MLLAEDNLPDTILVRQAIELAGLPIDLQVVSDGQSVQDFFARAEQDSDGRPHVLLLDLNLPKIEGLEILRRLRASDTWRDLPVMVISSSDQPRDRGAAADLGATYFRKPANYDAFLTLGPTLKAFLEQKKLLAV